MQLLSIGKGIQLFPSLSTGKRVYTERSFSSETFLAGKFQIKKKIRFVFSSQITRHSQGNFPRVLVKCTPANIDTLRELLPLKGRKSQEKTCHYSKTSMDETEPYGYVLNTKKNCFVIIPVTQADLPLQANIIFQIYASHFLRL